MTKKNKPLPNLLLGCENMAKDYYNGRLVWDFIEDMEFNFNLGNVVKYISRAGKKEGNTSIQDLEKARDYLEEEIIRLMEKELGVKL